jgi:triosephosphate isomerase
MRKKIVAGNWKMNLRREEGLLLVREIASKIESQEKQVVFAPSFLYLYKIAKICSNFNQIKIAAQNCGKEKEGAFTGEISAKMINSCNADYVIIGHSDRREYFNESNMDLKEKVDRALENKLDVIFCCGESLSQRENEVHFSWIKKQLSESLFHLNVFDFSNIVIAYEPIWAIGTGVTASTKQAQEMHAFIRSCIREKYDIEMAEKTSILYGGSCKPSNAIELFAQEDIDGGLIGGASLNAADFLAIINSF